MCKRGVRQGDPYSPLLFVLAADLLKSVINAAWANGELSLPINHAYGQDYPIIQYGDDTLRIMPADVDQIMHLKYLLNLFSLSTGLLVNYSKPSMIPINIDQHTIFELANSFGCKVESLPFTYLRLPLGTTKPTVQDLIPCDFKN